MVDGVGSSRVSVGSSYTGDIDDDGNFTPSQSQHLPSNRRVDQALVVVCRNFPLLVT